MFDKIVVGALKIIVGAREIYCVTMLPTELREQYIADKMSLGLNTGTTAQEWVESIIQVI
jgi:hypothetical protein